MSQNTPTTTMDRAQMLALARQLAAQDAATPAAPRLPSPVPSITQQSARTVVMSRVEVLSLARQLDKRGAPEAEPEPVEPVEPVEQEEQEELEELELEAPARFPRPTPRQVSDGVVIGLIAAATSTALLSCVAVAAGLLYATL